MSGRQQFTTWVNTETHPLGITRSQWKDGSWSRHSILTSDFLLRYRIYMAFACPFLQSLLHLGLVCLKIWRSQVQFAITYVWESLNYETPKDVAFDPWCIVYAIHRPISGFWRVDGCSNLTYILDVVQSWSPEWVVRGEGIIMTEGGFALGRIGKGIHPRSSFLPGQQYVWSQTRIHETTRKFTGQTDAHLLYSQVFMLDFRRQWPSNERIISNLDSDSP